MNRLLTLQRAAHASPVAMATLVAANAVPLAGVLFLGWDLATLVAVYWAENGVVGFYAVLRILTAGNAGVGAIVPQPPPPPGRPAPMQMSPGCAKWFIAPFFVAHYGTFWAVHGVFVWLALPSLFASLGGGGGAPGGMLGGPLGPGATAGPDPGVVVFAAAVMMVSHGVSFVLNWLIGGERDASNPGIEMGAPYARVIILHLTIILGSFAVATLGAPIWALVVMVALKTGVDLSAHLADRHRAASRMSAAPVSVTATPAA